MSKAVKADHEFNIDLYVELLKKAQGKRTQTEFAKDCGLSTAYICKHLNKRISTAPIPSTLKKIAAVADNDVTYEELLNAAGYDAPKYKSVDNIDSLHKIYGLDFNKFALTTITSALKKSNLKWSVHGKILNLPFLNLELEPLYDLDIELIDEEITHWYFKYITPPQLTKALGVEKSKQAKRIFELYGRLVVMPDNRNIKYSFVTDSQLLYDFIKKNTPSALVMCVSIIMIDVSTLSVIKEEYLKTYFSDKLDNNVSLSD